MIRLADDRGSVTLWLLGLCVCLLFLGGVSLDLWRAFGTRRALAGLVDAAAVAGSSVIDEPRYRARGELALDPGAAETRAAAVAGAHPDAGLVTSLSVAASDGAITVAATGEVPLTLLAVLDVGGGPFTVEVEATVEPRLAP